MPKLCIECEHHSLQTWGRFSAKSSIWAEVSCCTHPSVIKIDLVTGAKSYQDCYEMRKPGQLFCGDTGKLWEKKKNNDKGETSQHIPYYLGCGGYPG